MGRFVWVLLVAAIPTPALAGRVISIEVELDGKQVLDGSSVDDGFAGRQVVWRYLMRAPLHPVEGFTPPVDPADPSVAKLKGKLVVKVRYGADASATDLRLKAAPGSGWLVYPEWVEANAPPGSLAEDEQRATLAREVHRSERGAYRWESFAAVGFAVAPWIGWLSAVAMLVLGRRSAWCSRALAAAFGFGMLAVVCRFVGRPYFPNDDHAYDFRTYAMYSGIVSCGLTVGVWLLACRGRQDAEPNVSADGGDM